MTQQQQDIYSAGIECPRYTPLFPGPPELRTHFEYKMTHQGVGVWAVIWPLTRDQARLVFRYRRYSMFAESRYGTDNDYNDEYNLGLGRASRCSMCTAITLNHQLDDKGICPDCNGNSQLDRSWPFNPPEYL